MINLAWPDSRHNWGKLLITGCGLGLLVGVTVSMAGVYRGMMEDAEALIGCSGADLWVVEQHTLGPFAEASRIDDDLYRSIRQLPGVRRAVNGSFQTLLIQRPGHSLRVLVAGVEVGVPGALGQPPGLVAGRPLLRDRDELLADPGTGLQQGEIVPIRRTTGDPMLFVPFRDGQDLKFLPGHEAIARQRRRHSPAGCAAAGGARGGGGAGGPFGIGEEHPAQVPRGRADALRGAHGTGGAGCVRWG